MDNRERHDGQKQNNNLRRMGDISENDLRRKRRQIQEERHQQHPNCDGFNIDDGKENIPREDLRKLNKINI